MTKTTHLGVWNYKLTVYTHDALITSVAVLKYRLEETRYERPLIKTVYDAKINRAVTAIYTRTFPAELLRLLDFAAREYHSPYDAYAVSYDWDTKQLTRVAEQHRHGYHSLYPITGGEL